MSEMAKTMTFVAVAVVAMAAAYVSRPNVSELDVTSLVGNNLTKGFSDPDAAKRMKIVRFNEDTATLREFEVAEDEELWTIPSKDGYPADAEQQMALAATSLMDREILQVASDNAATHEQFGVVDPLSPKLAVGQKGVGTRVIMSDIEGEPLTDLIIGHPVKDAENQRFVREADRDVVYVIEIDPAKLTTDFEDWIEKDLLKINPWDLRRVEIKDYSADLVPVMTSQGPAIQVDWEPRAEMTLGYEDKAGKWSAERLSRFDPTSKEYVDFQLADDEQLNIEVLDGLKGALDDLRIVDVVRKPAGLSGNLKAGEDFLSNTEARQDLRTRGFTALSERGSNGDEIISTEGEVICTLIDGAEYVLRFGDLQLAEQGSGQQPQEGEAATTAGSKEGVHRYLFVMARFNEDVVPKPQLQELPALPEGKPEGEAPAAGEIADGEAASAAAEDKPATDATVDGDTADGEAALAAGDADTELARIIAERKRIEAENQQKRDLYQAMIKHGQDKVQALNARFGDWYYVVANDVFQKIRLSRDDVIKKIEREAAAAEGAPGIGVPGLPGQSIPGLPTIPGAGS